MKATIELIETYAVTINGVRHEGFRRESDWEGMMKLVRGNEVVIVNDEPLGGFARNVMGQPSECDVVKLSPMLAVGGESDAAKATGDGEGGKR